MKASMGRKPLKTSRRPDWQLSKTVAVTADLFPDHRLSDTTISLKGQSGRGDRCSESNLIQSREMMTLLFRGANCLSSDKTAID